MTIFIAMTLILPIALNIIFVYELFYTLKLRKTGLLNQRRSLSVGIQCCFSFLLMIAFEIVELTHLYSPHKTHDPLARNVHFAFIFIVAVLFALRYCPHYYKICVKLKGQEESEIQIEDIDTAEIVCPQGDKQDTFFVFYIRTFGANAYLLKGKLERNAYIVPVSAAEYQKHNQSADKIEANEENFGAALKSAIEYVSKK